MSPSETVTATIRVQLDRFGGESEQYHLEEGATLVDLLRLSGVSMTDQALFVGVNQADEATPLLDGVVVTAIPHPKEEDRTQPWHSGVPAFQDEALWLEYREILAVNRRADVSDMDPAE